MNRYTVITVACLASCALIPPCFALEVLQSEEKFSQSGGVALITVKDSSYTVTEVPAVANSAIVSPDPTLIPDLPPELNLGEPIDKDEALRVIDLYYRNVAIDYASIKLKDVAFHGGKFVTWCSQPWAFGCLNREFRAGNWIEFYVNGANRSGGMTGFNRQIYLVRKLRPK